MKDFRSGGRRWLSLKTIVLIMISFSALISLFLLYFMYNTSRSYNQMRTDTDTYIESRQGIIELKEASDFLTSRARSFTVTGKPEQAERFFEEVDVARRRQHSLEAVRGLIDDARILDHLESALSISEELVGVECHAMRLYHLATGNRPGKCPEALLEYILPEEDLALAMSAQIAKARSLVFDNDYEAKKDQLDAHIEQALTLLRETLLSRQIDSSDRLAHVIQSEQWLVAALMVSLLLTTVLIFLLVIRPLHGHIVDIGNEKMLEPRGSSELQFLARTYNAMFAAVQENNKRLSYEASHDGLTGLYNRKAYDNARRVCKDEGIALLIVDVDRFKEINDGFGHDIGDKVLRRVSSALARGFRSSDLVCRIGGDEFSVIMTHADARLAPLIREKIAEIGRELNKPLDEIPAVTLSVGVAFSEQRREDDDLFRCADQALYRVKEQGRAGCGFYNLDDTLDGI